MHFLLLLFIFFLLSCSGEAVPKDVFPPKKMTAVLYDIILADEWVDFARMQDSTFFKFSKRTAIYDSVFRIHGIKKEQYQKSMNFYQGRPDLLKQILDSLKSKADTSSPKPINRANIKEI